MSPYFTRQGTNRELSRAVRVFVADPSVETLLPLMHLGSRYGMSEVVAEAADQVEIEYSEDLFYYSRYADSDLWDYDEQDPMEREYDHTLYGLVYDLSQKSITWVRPTIVEYGKLYSEYSQEVSRLHLSEEVADMVRLLLPYFKR